ncbi:sodium-dependent nutrient amino acid transporter 1-like isoform X2 [Cylas formicarius]|uniref:sodium-dependent nutrient amino acid transporter 1-like isoform X2 n=1 Tax=Cylas formicarius TaxID=197179 RepID=UPI002958C76E|nr:sodium-dependent nutrient amino acid transporter 1-like isoform X2 [Cylas formicarius]
MATSRTQPDPNNADRATWGKSIEFLMSCIAMNVGLGNIWRFPFVAYENGGGAFLIPYILVLVLMGRPMYYLEMCLGQFSSRGNVKMFEKMAPALKGIGYGQLVGTACIATYYCALMAISLFYLYNSFTSSLPWSTCQEEWRNVSWLANVTCVASSSYDVAALNGSDTMSSAEIFYRVEVLNERVDISEGIGWPEWRLTVCLVISWATTFAVCAKGVRSSGKASYFLALFPYVILLTLLGRAVTLEGSGKGIIYFINPDWPKLLDGKVWYAAVSQCFFSLNIGFGSVTMYSSYNSFRHNVYRDAMVVTTLDTCTSLLSGTIIFGILGNLAHKMNVEVNQVIKSGGTGLAFISYPEAIARFEVVPWLFAILFFSVLFILGVGSLVALQGCISTVITDSFPRLKVWHVSLATVVGSLLVGLFYVTPGGQWIFTMVDFFGGTAIFYVLNVIEIISVFWFYGLEEFCLDVEFMLKRKTNFYWRICWCLLIPITLIAVFFYFVTTIQELTYEDKSYPTRVIVWGWVLLAFGNVQPLVWFGIELLRRRRRYNMTAKDTLKSLFEHTGWGPRDPAEKADWLEFKSLQRTTRALKLRGKLADKLCSLIGR